MDGTNVNNTLQISICFQQRLQHRAFANILYLSSCLRFSILGSLGHLAGTVAFDRPVGNRASQAAQGSQNGKNT